jgi:rifampicin phosphotransferase
MQANTFIPYTHAVAPFKYGGKANSLLHLHTNNIAVPAFVIIPHSILATKQNIDVQAIHNLLNSNYYAVRSSGADEDGSQHSFAGQYKTLLFVSKDNLAQSIQEVWQSHNSEHIQAYRKEHKLSTQAELHVIVQVMINSLASGVAFGTNPLTGNATEKVINSVWGVGEGLVSGHLNADSFWVNNNKITKSTIAKKDEFFTLQNNNLQKQTQELNKQNIASLSNEQVLQISQLLDKLEALNNHPQDIEFAIDENNYVVLLQSRPITTPFGNNWQVYDNSNIIESYPALTSPLTYSFIQKMYAAVYTQLSLILGVPKAKVNTHKYIYDNMLAHIKGRVYYNLHSWYHCLGLLPGYHLNARFMEGMMGVKERLDITIPNTESKLTQWINVVRAIFHILSTHNNIAKERNRFQANFNAISTEYTNFAEKSLSTLVDLYKNYEQTLVKKWNAPLINDFFAMIYFGLLKKLVAKYNLGNTDTLHNDLLAGSGDIVSTEPIHLCLQITDTIKNNDAYKKLFLQEDANSIWDQLQLPTYQPLLSEINNYLTKWGARCVGELKLETVTYNEQPTTFIAILQSYLNGNIDSSRYANNNATTIREKAEAACLQKLSGIKKIIFKYVLNKARDLVSNRENLRYERTKGFSMVRKLFLAMEQKLISKGHLLNNRDIFYLTQEEVYELVEKENYNAMQQIIHQRKISFEQWSKITVPERVQTYTDVHNHYFSTAINNQETLDAYTLQGVPCCAGIVEQRVCVLHSPADVKDLQGAILVTSSTDPGWVTLFPTASAILVERGSLLSHSAIVSREMGIPCIVGISNLLQKLKTGDIVQMDGSTGIIKIKKNV